MVRRFADLSVETDLDFPRLPHSAGAPDITIRQAPPPAGPRSRIQEWSDGDTAWLRIERGQDGYHLTFPDLSATISTRGHRITYAAAASSAETAHLLLHQVIPLAASRLGRFVLHACAIETARGAVALMGPSGAGKSTLAAAFCRRGALLASDDALVVDVSGTRATVWPTADGVRLWPDMQEVVGDLAAVTPAGFKVNADVPIASSPSRLSAMYIVGDTHDAGARIERISPPSARIELLRHVFRLDVGDPEESRVLLDAAQALASSVPAARLSYPDGIGALDGAVDAVMDDLACR